MSIARKAQIIGVLRILLVLRILNWKGNKTVDKIDVKYNFAILRLLEWRGRCDVLVAEADRAKETLPIGRTGTIITATLELFSWVTAEIWIWFGRWKYRNFNYKCTEQLHKWRRSGKGKTIRGWKVLKTDGICYLHPKVVGL